MPTTAAIRTALSDNTGESEELEEGEDYYFSE